MKIYPYVLHISFGNSQQRDYNYSMLYFYFNFTLRARGDLCYIYNNACLSNNSQFLNFKIGILLAGGRSKQHELSLLRNRCLRICELKPNVSSDYSFFIVYLKKMNYTLLKQRLYRSGNYRLNNLVFVSIFNGMLRLFALYSIHPCFFFFFFYKAALKGSLYISASFSSIYLDGSMVVRLNMWLYFCVY